MIKKLASHLGEYRRAALLTPMFSALEAVMAITEQPAFVRTSI